MKKKHPVVKKKVKIKKRVICQCFYTDTGGGGDYEGNSALPRKYCTMPCDKDNTF